MFGWILTGTESQKQIIRDAFARIKFPFHLLTLPGTPEIGWRDLNNGNYSVEKSRQHGDNKHDGDEPDAVAGEIEGRRFIMGVIYPMSGRIYLDVRLENYPEMAHATLGAEIAHAVDFFLPMTDNMRNALLKLWNVPGTTWWEVHSYGSEYYRLGGEAFMHEFVAAYSDIYFGNKSSFAHDIGVEPVDVWQILGIKRTDYVEPPMEKPKVTGKRWRKGTNNQDGIGGKGGSISQAEADRRANNPQETNDMSKNKLPLDDGAPKEGAETAPQEANTTALSGDTATTQLAEEGQDVILVGRVYREKGSGQDEVVVHANDFHSALVQFSKVGRSNEDRMRSSDFLNRFELVERSRQSEEPDMKALEEKRKSAEKGE